MQNMSCVLKYECKMHRYEMRMTQGTVHMLKYAIQIRNTFTSRLNGRTNMHGKKGFIYKLRFSKLCIPNAF